MSDLEDPVKKLSSKVIYQNRWMTIHEDTTKLPNGGEGIYGYLESKDSVMVAVFDNKNRIYLVRGFRYPSRSWGWELPGGNSDGEDLLAASKRELEEETGILADTWKLVGETFVCNGFMTERMATCVACDIHFDGTKEKSAETFADMQFFTVEEVDNLIDTGEINDCQTITGLHFAKRWLTRKETA